MRLLFGDRFEKTVNKSFEWATKRTCCNNVNQIQLTNISKSMMIYLWNKTAITRPRKKRKSIKHACMLNQGHRNQNESLLVRAFLQTGH